MVLLTWIGPSLSPSSDMPCPQKRAIDSAPSASTRRVVQKRDALAVNMKPSGTVWPHFFQVAGFCEE